MAGQIGRITAALGTVHNENSAALATLNFDFTLVKLQAPIEYSGLGATISHKRKSDAEEGALHKTARRLGALFGDILPSTDELFRAYGTRVSEISSMTKINPQKSADKAGIFASHIGIDTTSIWAAVTSGSAAIALHLLACMLARTFTGPEAISVWVELVKERKRLILDKSKDNLYAHENYAAMLAAQQDVSRGDLANWDASARAWLQSADQAKEAHHKQTMLIMNNASVPINNETETYKSVTKAWTVALEAMNNLIKGIPQRVQDGSVLLAISSWHLYPDMAVFGVSCVEVKQRDPLFTSGALLTLGLQHVQDDTKSVFWSLPLAYLQYYGKPVEASRPLGQENSRITCEEFAYIILGCLFAGWNSFATNNEQGIKWISTLAGALGLSEKRHEANSSTGMKWLYYLLFAARNLTECDDSERRVAHQLMNFGRRRSTFLHSRDSTPQPLFGLSQVELIIPLLQNDDYRVLFLRHLSSHLKVDSHAFFIEYQSSAELSRVEYANILPANGLSLKRMHDGEAKKNENCRPHFIRWISLDLGELTLCLQRPQDVLNVSRAMTNLEELQRLDEIEKAEMIQNAVGLVPRTPNIGAQQRSIEIDELQRLIPIGKRRLTITENGEICLPILHYSQDYHLGSKLILRSSKEDFFTAARDILEKFNNSGARSTITPTFFVGDADLAAVCSITETQALGSVATPKSISSLIVSPVFLEEVLQLCKFDTKRLAAHFSSSQYSLVQEEISCLRACAMMAEVYKLLPGATISTLAIDISLPKAKWVPRWQHRLGTTSLDLPQVFACIAMFESGTCNIDPDALSEVFAMSSGNSLYIAGVLLSDPHEQPGASEIRRVIGNIGRAGITFLISPQEVKIREADSEKWMAINHHPFDGKIENHFTQTSMHLSFTEYEISPIIENTARHTIDRPVTLVETLVSVFDGGVWVAEVDILKAFRSQIRRVSKVRCQNPRHAVRTSGCKPNQPGQSTCTEEHKYREAIATYPQLVATSVENWDELIEAPGSGIVVIRAHKNWLARLAAVAMCVRQQFKTIVLPEEPCWMCCAEMVPRYGSIKSSVGNLSLNDRVALIF